MIEHTKWVERSFPGTPQVGLFPMIVERLRGAPARAEEKVAIASPDWLARRDDDDWSIQEHVGHLGDLESLWAGRIDDFLEGRPELRAADMTNRVTHEANHNASDINDLLKRFRDARATLVERLDTMDDDGAAATASHPRLRTAMRVIDLCVFVAEHDDHHLLRMTSLAKKWTLS